MPAHHATKKERIKEAEDELEENLLNAVYCVHCGGKLKTFPNPHTCIEVFSEEYERVEEVIGKYQAGFREVEELKY